MPQEDIAEADDLQSLPESHRVCQYAPKAGRCRESLYRLYYIVEQEPYTTDLKDKATPMYNNPIEPYLLTEFKKGDCFDIFEPISTIV